MTTLEFKFRTGDITIDYQKCAGCKTHDCISACQKFGATLYRLENGRPLLVYSPEETERRCIEDLACEIYCQSRGNKGLTIHLDTFGLDEYRKKVGIA